MSAHDIDFDSDELPPNYSNVIAFRGRARRPGPLSASDHDPTEVHDAAAINMERFPVDIRGQVTFGRLMSGLATVGLTVRVDTRSGRVVITDDAWE